jgi:hypothetical protein
MQCRQWIYPLISSASGTQPAFFISFLATKTNIHLTRTHQLSSIIDHLLFRSVATWVARYLDDFGTAPAPFTSESRLEVLMFF